MFKLTNVYGVISFENNAIKLLVVEKMTNRNNCLFYKKETVNFNHSEFTLFHNKEVLKVVKNLLDEANNFIGLKINRYVINIADLNSKTINRTSKEFIVDKPIKEYEINDLINLSQLNVVNDNEYLINFEIISFIENDEYYTNSIDLVSNTDKLKIKANITTCKKEVIDQYVELCIQAEIMPLKFTNNKLAISGLFNEKNKNKAVVSIRSNKTEVNFYNTENLLIASKELDIGYQSLISQLAKKLTINNERKIFDVLKNISKGTLVDDKTTIGLLHQMKFLSIRHVTMKSLKKAINLVLEEFNQKIKNIKKEVVEKNKIDFDAVYLLNSFATDLLFNQNLYNDHFSFSYFEQNKNIIGLENHHIDHLIGAINLYLRDATLEKYTSADAFLYDKMIDNQIKNEIFLKLGIKTTRMVAKLGD